VHVKRNKTKHFPTRQNTAVSNVYRQCFCFESRSLAGPTLGYISSNHMHSRRSQGPALLVSDTNSSLHNPAPATSQHRQWSARAAESAMYLGLQFGWRGTWSSGFDRVAARLTHEPDDLSAARHCMWLRIRKDKFQLHSCLATP
jgi:hypothetical protein